MWPFGNEEDDKALREIVEYMKSLGDNHRFAPDFTQRTLEKMAAIRPFGVPATPLPDGPGVRSASANKRRGRGDRDDEAATIDDES